MTLFDEDLNFYWLTKDEPNIRIKIWIPYENIERCGNDPIDRYSCPFGLLIVNE